MDEILELASKLGERIAEDPRAAAMAAARKEIAASAEDRQLLADYESQQRKMHEMEAKGQPVEPDDKRRLAGLHEQVVASQVIKQLLKAQADYIELMSAVTRAIEEKSIAP